MKAEIVANAALGTDVSPITIAGDFGGVNYYMADPVLSYPTSADYPDGFDYAGSLLDTVKKISPSISGEIVGELDASADLMGLSMYMSATIPDIDAFIRSPGGDSIELVGPTVEGPEFPKPSFLDIMLLDPQAIVDALDGILKGAEDAALGPNGKRNSCFGVPRYHIRLSHTTSTS